MTDQLNFLLGNVTTFQICLTSMDSRSSFYKYAFLQRNHSFACAEDASKFTALPALSRNIIQLDLDLSIRIFLRFL